MTCTSFSFKGKKKSQSSRNQGFSYFFCLVIEGSRSGSVSGSIPLTDRSGSGSRRPKNMWIRWIRIRIRICNTDRNTAYLYDLYIAVPRRFLIGPGLALPSRHVFFSPNKHIKMSNIYGIAPKFKSITSWRVFRPVDADSHHSLKRSCIRIQTEVESWIRIRSKVMRICIKAKSWIRIRIKVMLIYIKVKNRIRHLSDPKPCSGGSLEYL